MPARVAIVTDSTCNLLPEQASSRHIYVAPLYIIWGETSYKDGVDIHEKELFQRLATTPDYPKTSQVSPQDFVDLFRKARATEQAEEIVCPVVSCDLSGTYASAIQARGIVDFPVHVVDTRQVSWGLGFAALAGADARDAGADAAGIVQAVQETAAHSKVVFTVETLDYLHRGGRIGGAARLLGSALNIKPVLEIREGVAEAADKVRTRKRAVEHLIKVAAGHAAGRPIRRLAVMHGDVEDEAKTLLEQAKSHFNPQESYLHYLTAVLGVHVGPGAIGVTVEWKA